MSIARSVKEYAGVLHSPAQAELTYEQNAGPASPTADLNRLGEFSAMRAESGHVPDDRLRLRADSTAHERIGDEPHVRFRGSVSNPDDRIDAGPATEPAITLTNLRSSAFAMSGRTSQPPGIIVIEARSVEACRMLTNPLGTRGFAGGGESSRAPSVLTVPVNRTLGTSVSAQIGSKKALVAGTS